MLSNSSFQYSAIKKTTHILHNHTRSHRAEQQTFSRFYNTPPILLCKGWKLFDRMLRYSESFASCWKLCVVQKALRHAESFVLCKKTCDLQVAIRRAESSILYNGIVLHKDYIYFGSKKDFRLKIRPLPHNRFQTNKKTAAS